MQTTAAITSYLNTRPLFHHKPPPDCNVLTIPPALTVTALLRDEIDAGIVPVAGLPLLEQNFELLGPYGIACQGPVLSVALFSDVPFEELDQRHRITLSFESMTSNRLLALLLRNRSGSKAVPKLTPERLPSDGELVIGDRALLRFYENKDRFITDLSETWWNTHRMPFVFARWVVRKTAAAKVKANLLNWLAEFVAHEQDLRIETVTKERSRYPSLSDGQMLDYLTRIRYFIGESEQQGQHQFLTESGLLTDTETELATPELTLLKAS